MSIQLLKAAKILGSQKRLAMLLGLDYHVLNSWINKDIRMPVQHALHIEVITSGAISAEDLVPHAKTQIQIYRQYLAKQFSMEKMHHA